MVFHLIFLHKRGRTSAVYSHAGLEKTSFFPFFWIKDGINVVWYIILVILILLFPYSIGEVELFEEANYLSSPVHIVPEWYFCSAYAILRRVPSKGIGVLIIGARVGILFVYPYSIGYITPIRGVRHSGWVVFFVIQVYLRYLGFSPIRQPFVFLSLVRTLFYFVYHFSIIGINLMTREIFYLEEYRYPPYRWWLYYLNIVSFTRLWFGNIYRFTVFYVSQIFKLLYRVYNFIYVIFEIVVFNTIIGFAGI